MQLGINIFSTIVEFFQNVGEVFTMEYMLYGFLGLEVLMIIIMSIVIHNTYELKLIRAVDKINGYLYNFQYIDESNLIEFNNKMKKVPKTLRYHWQQYMLYREHSPSYYMSIENCIDRPLKSSFFKTLIKVSKILGWVLATVGLILGCGALATTGATGASFYVSAIAIPAIVLILNFIFTMALQIKQSSNLSDLYQTFHIFNRFIDKAVATLPEYVDYEVLFTRAEIKKGIPVLNEYIEKRQLQEQEEMKRARLNAVEHEQYNFGAAGEKGTLVLERAMKETETFINLKHRLMTEIEQLEGEMESVKRAYDNKTKEYQKNIQTTKENVDRLREQMEATTNRIESNYIRKQQTDEMKKQEQLDRDQDDATLRFNQEISSLTAEIEKRKTELEEGRKYVEGAMLAEYKTFANKIFKDVRDDVNVRIKEERDELINSRELVISELEKSLADIEKLEKENAELKSKLGIKDAEYKSQLSKIDEELKSKEKFYSQILMETAEKAKSALETTKEPEYDEYGGYYDEEGYYRYKNGTYYDPEGNYHDEFGGVIDANGVYHAPETVAKPVEEVKVEPVEEVKEEPVETQKPAIEIKPVENAGTYKALEDIEPVIEEEEQRVEEVIEEQRVEEVKEEPVEEEEVAEPAKKRGRPRKEVLPVEEKPEARKRGRPRKEEVKPVEENKPAGKRGRPRKEALPVDEKPEAKKRGRPRKEVAPVEDKPEAKKRGRPRKEETKPVETNKPAGKRGRPRKEALPVEEKPEARKRGRPRKNDIDADLKKVEEQLKQQNEILKKQQQDLNDAVNNADENE